MNKNLKKQHDEIAKKAYNKGLLTKKQYQALINPTKQDNKGIVNECSASMQLGINKPFDNESGADFYYRGIAVQYKCCVSGSRPSVTELKKSPDESNEQFVDRILDTRYHEVQEFWLYIEDTLEFDINKCYMLNRYEFKMILLQQNIKDNQKIRLSVKKLLKDFTPGPF